MINISIKRDAFSCRTNRCPCFHCIRIANTNLRVEGRFIRTIMRELAGRWNTGFKRWAIWKALNSPIVGCMCVGTESRLPAKMAGSAWRIATGFIGWSECSRICLRAKGKSKGKSSRNRLLRNSFSGWSNLLFTGKVRLPRQRSIHWTGWKGYGHSYMTAGCGKQNRPYIGWKSNVWAIRTACHTLFIFQAYTQLFLLSKIVQIQSSPLIKKIRHDETDCYL